MQHQAKVEITDENAVFLACKGDAEAFSFLYGKNVTKIYNYIYYRIGSAPDAEDITSRVFYRAFGHINNYVDKGVPFSAWLYRIAHNLIANWHRDNQRRKEVPLEDHLDLTVRSDHPELWISADRQQLILLKYLENLSNAEIAVIMGRTEGAIKSLYHRALIALKEEIENLGYHSE
jgi:RNA polymerase sigma-70 factor (ECF subfamily)